MTDSLTDTRTRRRLAAVPRAIFTHRAEADQPVVAVCILDVQLEAPLDVWRQWHAQLGETLDRRHAEHEAAVESYDRWPHETNWAGRCARGGCKGAGTVHA